VIAALNRAALRQYAQDRGALRLTNAPAAAAQVRELVDQESRCCSVLRFDLDASIDGVYLTVRGPAGLSEDNEHTLFAPFLCGVTRL